MRKAEKVRALFDDMRRWLHEHENYRAPYHWTFKNELTNIGVKLMSSAAVRGIVSGARSGCSGFQIDVTED